MEEATVFLAAIQNEKWKQVYFGFFKCERLIVFINDVIQHKISSTDWVLKWRFGKITHLRGDVGSMSQNRDVGGGVDFFVYVCILLLMFERTSSDV